MGLTYPRQQPQYDENDQDENRDANLGRAKDTPQKGKQGELRKGQRGGVDKLDGVEVRGRPFESLGLRVPCDVLEVEAQAVDGPFF